jgi:outer membrane protein assembly factor BamB
MLSAACEEQTEMDNLEVEVAQFETEYNEVLEKEIKDSFEVINATFLGNSRRAFYGSSAPRQLSVLWKHNLGKGQTVVTAEEGKVTWKGAGWTGQPLFVREKDEYFLIQGAYDHHLKKIKAESGELVWEYAFNNVIKGTGTLWNNQKAESPENSQVVLQGARKNINVSLNGNGVYSFRAISYFTGKELWRVPIRRGKSYSRDVDASALVIKDKIYVPAENGYLLVLNPYKLDSLITDSMLYFTPEIVHEIPLFEKEDSKTHHGNLVTEASPVLLGDKLYIASGAGHVYEIDTNNDTISWRFDIGADLDGTPAITLDKRILVPIEKQYIKGMGGVLQLNPNKKGMEAVDWFFPTEDVGYKSWEGGVIGSVITFSKDTNLYCAFSGLDGWFYVVQTNKITAEHVTGYDNVTVFYRPELVAKFNVGPSISTPLFIAPNSFVVAGYKGVHLLQWGMNELILKDFFKGTFEATPFVYDEKIYIASRNGYLYCLGNDSEQLEIKPIESESQILLAESTFEADLDPLKIEVKQSEKPKTTSTAISKTTEATVLYHAVAGAFGDRNNATRKLEELKGQGFNASIIPGRKGLEYVVMESFNNKEAASAFAKKHNLWVYYASE